jgi:ribosome-binding factor A
MSSSAQTKAIKQSQRETQLLREISQLFRKTALDDPRLAGVFINRVQLSPDSGICTAYFYSVEGEEHFNQVLDILKLYRPSLRKALAERINRRYTPDLIFKYDTQFDKHERLEELFEKIKDES